MRILFALNTLGFGGAEVFTARLANALSHRGHKIFVYVHNYGFDGLNLLTQFDPTVTVVFFHRNKLIDFLSWKANALFSFIREDFREWIKERWIKRFIKKNNIQIVSSQGIVTDAWFSKIDLDIPVVSTIHE
ncbi:MAG TPA: glycosyltransferase, partial [Cyclobacteriaceae bacterium]|nr:glycosyltransferase [Cyclobacteriaceae bacterium]